MTNTGLEYGHHRVLDVVGARDRASDLDRAADRELALNLARAREVPSYAVRLSVPMTLPGRLIAVAAWLLPGAERARYGEEFGSELAEIVRAGGGRRAQLGYAVRTVLSSAWQLRTALRSPRRRGAV